MEIPDFLIADNTDFPNDVFVIHTAFPRFILNVQNDEIEWWEEFEEVDEKELMQETENLVRRALEFYDREIKRYEKE